MRRTVGLKAPWSHLFTLSVVAGWVALIVDIVRWIA